LPQGQSLFGKTNEERMGFEGDVPKSTYTEGIYVQIALCGYWVAMDYPGSNNYGVQDDAIMMLQICTW